jgi:glycerate 2-kinase
MTRVLVAPDKFKGTLTSAEVASHLAGGLRAARPDVETNTAAIADGGDGLLDAFQAAGFERVHVRATDALGAVAWSAYVRREGQAVVELAEVAGLAACRSDRAPLTATSRGVGEVIAAALDAGCRHVLLGIGGSASTDGGIGMVQALGARVLDSAGGEVGPGGVGAMQAVAIDLTFLHPALAEARLEVACDVDNPLTGPGGAAAVYGPQKGADDRQVQLLDAALGRWADLVSRTTGTDLRATAGAGAAGGVGYAALSLLGADLRPGARLVLDILDIPASIARADLVITGEGSLDEQTLRGKAPAAVAESARKAGVPVVVVAGQCHLDAEQIGAAGFSHVYTLLEEAGSEEEAFASPGPLLRRIGARIAQTLGPVEGGDGRRLASCP